MKLSTRSFRGMAPRISQRLLPPEASSNAINARLLTGDLTAWKAPAFSETFANGDIVRTIFKLRDRWLSFTDDVEIARGTILGDTDYRAYITGLDVPRFTTYDLAFNSTGAAPYPIVTRPLGVPGPDDVPLLALSVPTATEGGITIVNPGAEEGDDTGWTQTTPDLTVYENGDIPGIVANTGTFWFYGGTGSSGEYYQSFNASGVGVAVGQNLTLTWAQATGAAGSQAQLGLRFYDGGANLVGEQFAEMTAPSPANTWQTRSVATEGPADTETFRIVIKFQNVGGGTTDAYIDTITLQSESLDYSSSGNDLSAWTQSSTITGSTPYRSVIQQDIGGTHGSVFVFRSDEAIPYIYQQFGYADAASFRIEWSGRLNYSNSSLACGIGLLGGVGDIISVRQNRVSKASTSAYDGSSSGLSTLADLNGSNNLGSNWFRVVITGARSGTSQFSVTVTVTNLTTGVVVCDAAETTMNVPGNELLFRYYSNQDGGGERGYLDDIISSVVPDTGGADQGATLLTSYVYRYVNDFGEASAPSLPSRIIQRSDGVTVTVTTDTTIPSGISEDYGITFKQIYRAATGSAGTVFRFVAEIPLAQADYVDTLDDDELGEVLDSEDWDLPPEDLRYILALPNGIMVGASKNQLCFSVQNRPHAWPVAYRLPTDTDITGLGNIDNAVVIGTESFVYTASGNSPDSYSMSKPGAPHACQSARSFAYLLNSGVIFAGPDGLMSVRSATEVVNLTEGIFTRDQWQTLDPTSITGVAHDDIYFFFFSMSDEVVDRYYAGLPTDAPPGILELAARPVVDETADYIGYIDYGGDVLFQSVGTPGYLTGPETVLIDVNATGVVNTTGYSIELVSNDFTGSPPGNQRATSYGNSDYVVLSQIDQPTREVSSYWNGTSLVVVNYTFPESVGINRRYFSRRGSRAYYAASSPGPAKIYRFNALTGEYVASSSTLSQYATAVLYNGTSNLYVWLETPTSELQILDADTLAFVSVAPTPPSNVQSLFSDANGSVYIFCNNDNFYKLNGSTWDLFYDPVIDFQTQWFVQSPSVYRSALSFVIYNSDTNQNEFYAQALSVTGAGYALDTRATGNGMTALSMHASAAAVDIKQDALYMVLDSYTDAAGEFDSGITADGLTLYQWNASTDLLPYEWNSKLWLLPHPMALQWCRVRASEYTDIVISFFADGSLLYTKTVTDNKAFRIRVRQDYSKLTFMLEGSSEIYSVEISDDVNELE